MRVKNRNVSAVDGWQFHQAQFNRDFHNWDFNSIVNEIRQARLGNPRFKLPTDIESIANEVDEVNALRMSRRPGCEHYVMDTTPPKSMPLPLLQRAAHAVAGAKVLVKWLMSGAEAVAQMLATQRASVCVECPLNDKSQDWNQRFEAQAAAAIREAINQRRDWALSTPHDDQLGTCTACSCPLALKIHLPLDRIRKEMPKEDYARLAPQCWIKNEPL